MVVCFNIVVVLKVLSIPSGTRSLSYSFHWLHFLISCSEKPLETTKSAQVHEIHFKVCVFVSISTVLSRLYCANELPEDLVKVQILI